MRRERKKGKEGGREDGRKEGREGGGKERQKEGRQKDKMKSKHIPYPHSSPLTPTPKSEFKEIVKAFNIARTLELSETMISNVLGHCILLFLFFVKPFDSRSHTSLTVYQLTERSIASFHYSVAHCLIHEEHKQDPLYLLPTVHAPMSPSSVTALVLNSRMGHILSVTHMFSAVLKKGRVCFC